MDLFNSGVSDGIERYSQMRGKTFDTPDQLLGALAGTARGSDYMSGYAHGLALGASLQLDAMVSVVAMRRAKNAQQL